MALDDYAGLKAELVDNIARSDTTSSSSKLDTFIDMAEAYMNKKLNCLQMQERTTITTTSGDSRYDFASDYVGVVQLTSRLSHAGLKFTDYSSWAAGKTYGATGSPSEFTVGFNSSTGRYEVEFYPAPDGVYVFDLIYKKKLPPLSSIQTTNWLFSEYPNIYLNGALHYAFKRFRNPLAADYLGFFEADIALVNESSERSFGGGAGMAMRAGGTVV